MATATIAARAMMSIAIATTMSTTLRIATMSMMRIETKAKRAAMLPALLSHSLKGGDLEWRARAQIQM